MFKKILLITILFFMFFSLSFSNLEQDKILKAYDQMTPSQQKTFMSTKISSPDGKSKITVEEAFSKNYLNDNITGLATKDALNTANVIITNPEKESGTQTPTPTTPKEGSLASPDFTIDTSLFSPGGTEIKGEGTTAKVTAQNALLTIIEKLILAIGVVALFIMTIGAGYMIMYHGEDSLLTRGKYMFNSGLIAIALALSAELIVKFVAYLLY